MTTGARCWTASDWKSSWSPGGMTRTAPSPSRRCAAALPRHLGKAGGVHPRGGRRNPQRSPGRACWHDDAGHPLPAPYYAARRLVAEGPSASPCSSPGKSPTAGAGRADWYADPAAYGSDGLGGHHAMDSRMDRRATFRCTPPARPRARSARLPGRGHGDRPAGQRRERHVNMDFLRPECRHPRRRPGADRPVAGVLEVRDEGRLRVITPERAPERGRCRPPARFRRFRQGARGHRRVAHHARAGAGRHGFALQAARAADEHRVIALWWRRHGIICESSGVYPT